MNIDDTNEGVRIKNNNNISEHSKISFNPEDIKYIIVNSEDEENRNEQ